MSAPPTRTICSVTHEIVSAMSRPATNSSGGHSGCRAGRDHDTVADTYVHVVNEHEVDVPEELVADMNVASKSGEERREQEGLAHHSAPGCLCTVAVVAVVVLTLV
jgi:hypothetical protein